jgi:hypothetical protein
VLFCLFSCLFLYSPYNFYLVVDTRFGTSNHKMRLRVFVTSSIVSATTVCKRTGHYQEQFYRAQVHRQAKQTDTGFPANASLLNARERVQAELVRLGLRGSATRKSFRDNPRNTAEGVIQLRFRNGSSVMTSFGRTNRRSHKAECRVGV